MKSFMILLKKEGVELWKTKKAIIFLIVALIFAVLAPIMAYVTPDLIHKMDLDIKMNVTDPTVVDAYLQFFKSMSQLVLLVMIVLFATSIPEEKSKGTIKTLFTNHVSIKNFVFAKVLVQMVVATLVYLIAIGGFLLTTWILFKTVQVPHPVLAFTSLYGYIIFLIVVINLIGTLSQKPTTSITLSVIVFLILAMTGLIPKVGQYVPNYLLTAPSMLVSGTKNLTSWYWALGITGVLTILAAIGSTQSKKFY